MRKIIDFPNSAKYMTDKDGWNNITLKDFSDNVKDTVKALIIFERYKNDSINLRKKLPNTLLNQYSVFLVLLTCIDTPSNAVLINPKEYKDKFSDHKFKSPKLGLSYFDCIVYLSHCIKNGDVSFKKEGNNYLFKFSHSDYDQPEIFEGVKLLNLAYKFVDDAIAIGLTFKNPLLAEYEKVKNLNEELGTKNLLLREKEGELEDIMSMFAHKFRSPLDAIIYNTTHENQPKLYAQAAQTMRGLLDVFSIISTDETVLKNRLMQDMQGDSGLLPVFDNTLNMIMMHLLSVSGAEKIQQHYISYAKSHGLCGPDISRKVWNEEHYELERQLQTDWEQSYAALLNRSATLEQRLSWIEERFFKLELHGFERTDIQFKAYGITESLLTILLNEILVNAFKYYSSADRQPVRMEWTERGIHHWLICRNPSIRNERTRQKGSGKGHVFLSALARKTGSQFTKPKPLDDFVLEFGIPNELLKTD